MSLTSQPKPSQPTGAEQAAEATATLVQLMPEEWRDDPGIPALTELPKRPDCEAVLKELTRGVPLHMLLDRSYDSLHAKNDRSLLAAPDFFLSTPNDDILAFISHRWAAEQSMTVQGLHMAIILRFFNLFFRPQETMLPDPVIRRLHRRYPMLKRCNMRMFLPGFAFFFFLEAFALPLVCSLPLLYYMWSVAPMFFLVFFDPNSFPRIGIRRKWEFLSKDGLGPAFWFDKACVHQTEPCLNQAGIALFPYYLKKAKQLWILFTPEYLTRIWCIYELATWLRTKPDAPVFIVPLLCSARLYRGLLRWWPWFALVLISNLGWSAIGVALFHQRQSADIHTAFNVAQDIRRFVWGVVFIAVIVIAATFVAAYFRIAWPLRQERLCIAKQLELFDVADCSAFYEKDKDYVLGLIAEWFGEAGDDQRAAALGRFNKLVRTRVARRLRRTLLMSEARLVVFLLVLTLMVFFYLAIYVEARPPLCLCHTSHTLRNPSLAQRDDVLPKGLNGMQGEI